MVIINIFVNWYCLSTWVFMYVYLEYGVWVHHTNNFVKVLTILRCSYSYVSTSKMLGQPFIQRNPCTCPLPWFCHLNRYQWSTTKNSVFKNFFTNNSTRLWKNRAAINGLSFSTFTQLSSSFIDCSMGREEYIIQSNVSQLYLVWRKLLDA